MRQIPFFQRHFAVDSHDGYAIVDRVKFDQADRARRTRNVAKYVAVGIDQLDRVLMVADPCLPLLRRQLVQSLQGNAFPGRRTVQHHVDGFTVRPALGFREENFG